MFETKTFLILNVWLRLNWMQNNFRLVGNYADAALREFRYSFNPFG